MQRNSSKLNTQPPTGRGVKLFPLWKTPFNQAGSLAPTLTLSLVALFFVLLIACANVSSLLLVRSLARQHEITVRLALGCRPNRLLRQLLTEGLILSILSGVSGLAVAYFCRNLLAIFFPLSSVIATNLSGQMDWRVLAFSAAVCVTSTLMFALVPTFQTSNLDIAGALKAESATSSGSRSKSRLRSTMVLAQVSLSFVLLVGGTLLVQNLQRLRSADPASQPITWSRPTLIWLPPDTPPRVLNVFVRMFSNVSSPFLESNPRPGRNVAPSATPVISKGQSSWMVTNPHPTSAQCRVQPDQPWLLHHHGNSHRLRP